jgi:hypothetical protein
MYVDSSEVTLNSVFRLPSQGAGIRANGSDNKGFEVPAAIAATP